MLAEICILRELRIVLLGAPGSGKGTQGRLLSEFIRVRHISLGGILRTHIERKTPIGKIIQEHMQAGNLVSDELANQIMEVEIGSEIGNSGCVVDGYPRTISQADYFEKMLEYNGVALDMVIALELDNATILKRNLGRSLCPKCGRDYNDYFEPPNIPEVCSNCDSVLERRNDCRDDIIKHRLIEYEGKTKFLFCHYESQGIMVRVNGIGSKSEIHRNIVERIKQIK